MSREATTGAIENIDLKDSPPVSKAESILAEVTRFPVLGKVFWRAGPERERAQIEAFLKRAIASGTLTPADTRLAAEQFVALIRGDVQLRHLLRLDADADRRGIGAAVDDAVATFLRAFEPRNGTSAI